VFIGSSCGEPQHLVQTLLDQTGRFSDLELVHLHSLEGSIIGLIDEETQGNNFQVRSIYQGSGLSRSLVANKRFLTSINLHQAPELFRQRRLPLHFALIQTTPPDALGWMNLGVSVDITLAAAMAADVVVAQVNPRLPRVPGYGMIHVDEVDYLVEREEDVLTALPLPELPETERIAQLLANLIPDGSTIQIAPGLTTRALLLALGGKNDLGVHTFYLTDALMELTAAGVVTNRRKGVNEGKSVASAAVGSRRLYDYLDGNPAVEFRPADYASHPGIIAQHQRMTAVNLASIMDLKGQVAADALPQTHFSGVTGIVDFVRGASLSPNGKSIVVLSSRTPDGGASAIVPELPAGAVVVAAGDVSWVVSECGAVNLFGKNNQERAMAMISLAHPDFREALFAAAKECHLIGSAYTLHESLYGSYPGWMEETKKHGDVEVLLRPAKASDQRLIQEHFYEMETQDVENRFFGYRKKFSRDDVSIMFQVDYRRNFSVVAFTGDDSFGKIVGVGGYMADEGSSVAEVAFSVSKEWQGKGLAGALQRKVVDAALENGLSGLVAITRAANHSMIRLFKKLPYEVTVSYDDGLVVLKCNFGQPADHASVEKRS
jgi:acyl-CoA hydrolase/RimJ/RimL family protein N-acetyltransferase